jgi:hypothetical protein
MGGYELIFPTDDPLINKKMKILIDKVKILLDNKAIKGDYAKRDEPRER